MTVFKITFYDNKGFPIRTVTEYKEALWNMYYNIERYKKDKNYTVKINNTTALVYEKGVEGFCTKLALEYWGGRDD